MDSLVATEMSPKHLHSHCCNGLYLAHMLRAIGVAQAVAQDKQDPVTQRAVCAGLLFGNDSFNQRRLCAHFGSSAREVVPSDGQPWAVSCIRPPSYWLKRNKETTCISRRPLRKPPGTVGSVVAPPPASTQHEGKGIGRGYGSAAWPAAITPLREEGLREKGLREEGLREKGPREEGLPLAHETPDLPPRLAWQRTKLAQRWISTCEDKEKRTLVTIAAETPAHSQT